jgi:prepilin-type N-terminal cleavage/methylation domain-containing protein
MTLRSASRRSGFTLLELLLASMIAAMLLYALYFLMNITLRQTSDARDAIEIDSVARGAFNRMSLDLSAVLGPLPPKSGGNNDSAPDAVSTPTTTTTTPTDPSTAAAPTDGSTTPTTEEPPAKNNPLQAGLIGEEEWFIVYVSRVPDPLSSPAAMLQSTQPGAYLHDLRLICYYLGDNGGLCRQVRPYVTADGVLNATGPDRSTEANDLIVDEVSGVKFEYLSVGADGTPSWQNSWNGGTEGEDTVTPMGPPRAVRVTLKMKFPSGPNHPEIEKSVVHVIPIRTSPGVLTPPLIDPATDTGTAPTDPSGTGTTGTSGTGSTPSGSGSTPTSGTGNTGSAPAGNTGGTPTGGGTTPGGGGGTTPGGGTRPGGGGR